MAVCSFIHIYIYIALQVVATSASMQMLGATDESCPALLQFHLPANKGTSFSSTRLY